MIVDLADEIARIAQQHLNGVRMQSDEVSAYCPFHIAKTPGASFSMSRTTGLWLCFSCHARGNLRNFLRDLGLSHTHIDGEYSIVLEAAAQAMPQRMDPLYPNLFTKDPIPESLLGLFEFVPIQLEREGFLESTLSHFDVGVDKHHMRITFPFRDLKGSLVGISGRAINDEDDAGMRYKLYNKEYEAWGLPARYDGGAKRRAVLWNAERLYPTMKNTLNPDVVVVEGFKGCMWVYQAGIKEVVALLGSDMSEEQQWILERMGARVVLLLDNNKAGRVGTYFIGRRLAKGLEVRVGAYRTNDNDAQPSDLTSDEIHEAIGNASDYYRWKHDNREALSAVIKNI